MIRRALVAMLLLVPAAADAQERHAIIVAGASGGAAYARQYGQWSQALSATLVDRFDVDSSRVTVLSDTEEETTSATAANVRRALNAARASMSRDSMLFVMLIGHGTSDGLEAKFNLVGPDLESAEWAALLKGIPGTVVVVNTTSASFPFIERLAGPRRIVISATNSVAQKFDTVFPDYFIRALADEQADIDKNGRISIWEAFAAAASGVRRHYQQRGQLSTETAVLDDDGDGVGREAAAQGEDGSLASRTYLDVTPAGAPPTDEVLLRLLQLRATLEAEVEELRIKKAFMQVEEYAKEFERLMIALARVARDIRDRVKS